MIHVEELCWMRNKITIMQMHAKAILYDILYSHTYTNTSLDSHKDSEGKVSSRDVSRRALQVPSLMASCSATGMEFMEASHGTEAGWSINLSWKIQEIKTMENGWTWMILGDLGNLHVPSVKLMRKKQPEKKEETNKTPCFSQWWREPGTPSNRLNVGMEHPP